MKPGVKKFSRKERPMGGRKDKEARELALRDQREVCVVCVCVCVCVAGGGCVCVCRHSV